MHSAPGETISQVCQLKAAQGSSREFEDDLFGSDQRASRDEIGGIRSKVGHEVSDDQSGMEAELGEDRSLFSLSIGDKKSDLHNQCDRVSKTGVEKDHKESRIISK